MWLALASFFPATSWMGFRRAMPMRIWKNAYRLSRRYPPVTTKPE